MKTKLLAVVMGFAMVTGSGVACAQFGGLGKLAGGDAAAASVSADQIVKSYVGGSKDVNTADVKMLRAVGLKEEAVGWALDENNRKLITPEMESKINAAKADIISGKIQVVDYRDNNSCPAK